MAHSRKRKADRADLTEADRVQLELLGPERYHKLMYTIASLAMAWPFQWTEHPLMRRLLSAVPDWPTLHPRLLRHHIVEVYKATVVGTQTSLLDVKNSLRGLNPFHLNLDLWTSKVSKQKFLGARVFYVNQDFTPESRLLGVKLFDPPHDLVRFRNGRRRLSDLLLLWLKMMLGEYHIQLSDFRSSTSDSGPDVKRLLSKLMPDSSWDWCIPHLINRAFTDAFGASVDVQASKNVECRELITKLKKQIQYFHQREGAATLLKDLQESLDDSTSALRLLSDVPQRWSSIAKLLKRALELWGLMETASWQRIFSEVFNRGSLQRRGDQTDSRIARGGSLPFHHDLSTRATRSSGRRVVSRVSANKCRDHSSPLAARVGTSFPSDRVALATRVGLTSSGQRVEWPSSGYGPPSGFVGECRVSGEAKRDDSRANPTPIIQV
jgi:hypothetical protein